MDYGYVAGFFDGEGSVKNARRSYAAVFYNTDLAALQSIHSFIGVGQIYSHAWRDRKVCYRLEVFRRDELLMLIPHLLDRCIVKREKLLGLHERLLASPDRYPLTKLGRAQIEQWYLSDGLSVRVIATRAGVTPSAVRQFLQAHSIPRRTALGS